MRGGRGNYYLEAHMGFLATCDVLSGGGNSQIGNLIIVASEKGLGSGDNVPDDDCRAQREKKVLIIRVKD